MPDTLLARDLMTTTVVTVRPDMPVASLARLLADRGISSAPVTDATGKLLGIVTEADLLRRLAGTEDREVGWLRRRLLRDEDKEAEHYARTHGLTAADVMTRDLVSVEPTATAAHCAHVMEERRVKRLPVVVDGRLAGVVSRADLLRALLEPPARIGAGTQSRDERIRAALRTEMRNQPWADSIYIFADVKDGVVTLHGFVRSDSIRRGLRVLAGRIEGVERVEDKLEDAPPILVGEMV
jgi:CBS domain-containing protein